MINWLDPTYLAAGTQRQQAAYRTLEGLRLFAILNAYSPVLAGTIPLDVDVASSDLDILCQVNDLEAFERLLSAEFGHLPEFSTRRAPFDHQPTVLADFAFHGERIEIFGQARPVLAQTAYRHLVIEAALLSLGGEHARSAIRGYKQNGEKTEPAFARYFHLEGDPYRALLLVAELDEESLRRFVSTRQSDPQVASESRGIKEPALLKKT